MVNLKDFEKDKINKVKVDTDILGGAKTVEDICLISIAESLSIISGKVARKMALDIGGITAPPENNILQSFSDATAGRSMQLFYGAATKDSVGVDYVLIRDIGNSRPTNTNATATFDLDFDLTINKPTIVAGIATVDIDWLACNGSGGAVTQEVKVDIIHYDGTTETELGTATTETVSVAVVTTTPSKLQISVTRKLFGIGDTLRLRTYGTGGGGASKQVGIWHDPQTAGNMLRLWLPIVNLE